MTPAQLTQIGLAPPVAQEWAPVLTAVCALYAIDTPLRQAAFLGQCAHESGMFTAMVEDLDYSAQALRAVWPLHFTEAQAQQYGRTADHPANPEMIANLAYANRMGNGPSESGDGWTYRGRGVLQNTGRSQYDALSGALGINLIQEPALLAQPTYAARAAGIYWRDHGLNSLADAKDWIAITRAINGGTAGLLDRLALTERALGALQT